MSEQHKHGLMGTNPHVRPARAKFGEERGSARGGEGRHHPMRYEREMEEWYETGKSPWATKVTPLVPVTGEMMDAMLGRRRRYWAVRRGIRTARWRVQVAWAVLRHGYGTWDY